MLLRKSERERERNEETEQMFILICNMLFYSTVTYRLSWLKFSEDFFKN